MKRVIFLILLTGLLSSVALAVDEEECIIASRSVVKQFGGELKSELKEAMQSGGPIQAIDVCKKIAPKIAARASEQTGWRVGRTALKVRNSANTPDGGREGDWKILKNVRPLGKTPKRWSILLSSNKMVNITFVT